MPKREVEICKRLRDFRLERRLSRSKLSLALGVEQDRIANCENRRTPLRFDMFLRLRKKYQIDPFWLATGEGDMYDTVEIEEDVFQKATGRELFTEVFDQTLAFYFDPIRRMFVRTLFRVSRDIDLLVRNGRELEDAACASPYLAHDVSKSAQELRNALLGIEKKYRAVAESLPQDKQHRLTGVQWVHRPEAAPTDGAARSSFTFKVAYPVHERPQIARVKRRAAELVRRAEAIEAKAVELRIRAGELLAKAGRLQEKTPYSEGYVHLTEQEEQEWLAKGRPEALLKGKIKGRLKANAKANRG